LTLSIRKNQFTQALCRALLAWLSFVLFPEEVLSQVRNNSPAQKDTTKSQNYTPNRRPTYRPTDRYGDPFSNRGSESPLFLKDPSRMKLDVDIDTAGNYTIYEKIGNVNYRPTSSMSFEEFKQYQDRQILKSYWQSRSRAQDGESAVSGRSLNPKIFVSPVLDRIFGGSYVELVPRGFVTLDFGAAFQKINNPSIPIRQQRNGGFEFDQQINMSVVGKVGEKLAVTANFDNNNSFDFQNNMKVEYTGYKEDILQKLEIGNVSLPLNNTLIQGAQNLFGIKAKMQFGKLTVTSIATTQRGKTSSINVGGGGAGGGGQGRPFEIIGSNYDENRHFFLGQFFRDHYEQWISSTPQITSGVNVTRVEVYVLNRNNDTQTLRNVVGLMDLGEGRRIYSAAVQGSGDVANDNTANNLFSSVKSLNRNADNINAQLDALFGANGNGLDYEKITGARKLAPTEFTFNAQLGYITLTRKLQNDEALAVAYQYTYNGVPHKVGELTEDYSTLKDDEVVFLKLLRPRKIAIRDQNKRIIPTWDLMMKNIYNLNVNQLSRDNFQLRIIYRDDRTGIDNPQLQDGNEVRKKQLIQIFGLDRLNPVNDLQPDGNFDYVEGITINSTTGLIIFPYLEPFSEALRKAFATEPNQSALIQKYSYDTLYRTTKADAELFATKNKFYIKGTYNAGSSKEILIPGFGVSQGSVKVYAGGIPLNEGTDFVVDYTFGKVTILNESILSSGKNIEVKYEQSDPFAFQTRSLLGTRLDYRLNEDVNFGSTLLYYNERPLVSRNQIGTEPARNLMYGLDFNVNKKSRMLTKIVDALPFLQTKEQSTVNVTGEFAQLLPGTSNVVNGEGIAYIDDFENTATPYSLLNPFGWKLSSVPKTDDYRFDPSQGATNNITAGYRRAKLAWYTIDNQFQREGGRFRPDYITDEDMKNHYVRGVGPKEIFPARQLQQGVFFEQILDVAYYPRERGPYNYNPALDNNGFLSDPKSNWGGITSAIKTEVDFDKANIEYVEFWLLNPFIDSKYGVINDGINPPKSNTTGGKLIFQVGSISEDVARDSKHAFENGLPPDGDFSKGTVTPNEWGYVTNQQYLTNGFDNTSDASRTNQDVGLDGLPTDKEKSYFQNYLNSLNAGAREKAEQDPSGDNFKYFLDKEFDQKKALILERYKDYNGQDGNTPIASNTSLTATASYQNPDNEDLNADNTLSELEEYYQYDMDLKPGLEVGQEYIVDKVITTTENASKESVTWYQYRIPIREFEAKFGNIEGFKSIRYIRMMLTGFDQPVVLRFANFRLIGSRWRRYTDNLREGGLTTDPEPNADNFTVSVVNLEENSQEDVAGNKSAYRIPPGVVRDRDVTSSVSRQLNEQSVRVCIDNLQDGDARAIYKNVSADLFNYGKIKMFFHANSYANDNQLYGFIRLGTDFTQNYYEIELPLKISNPSDKSERGIWPEENEIDLSLNDLYALKAARDRAGASLTEVYPREGPKQVGHHGIRIFGRPDLSSVQVIMIGVRNPRSDDKQSLSLCFWANELRVTDFNRAAGWAVNSTLNAKLADFATLNGAFRHTTFGFGAVSSKISERTRDNTTAYDLSASVNVDKLLPGNTGIKIPMFLSYENTTINPQYDPANPDMKIDALLKSYDLSNPEERARKDAYLKIIQDQTVRRSLNFTNVRKVKVRPDAKTHLWDVENLSFSYAYSEATRRNFTTAEALQKQYKGSVAYQFNPKSTGIEPFKNIKSLSSPWLKLIKDFNFNLMPSSLGVRMDLDRSFTRNTYRNQAQNGEFQNSDPTYMKYFTFNRTYNMRWDLSKGLSIEYNARANAIIDEPDGDIDTPEKKKIVKDNLKKFGRMKNFDQSVTLNYTLPLDKLPITDWLGADYRHQVSYNWRAGAANIADSLNFKNTIQNSRDRTFTGRIDMVKLYNKVKFLKTLNTPKPQSRPNSANPRVQQTRPKNDTTKVRQPSEIPSLVKGFFRVLMSLRSINGTYGITEGTILPGFTESPYLFGMNKGRNAPGWGFVLGSQDPNIRWNLANDEYITKNPLLTNQFSQVRNETINIRANIEPSTDLKIQLDVKKETTNSYQEIFRYDEASNGYTSLSPTRSGSYRISIVSIKTAFNKSNGSITSDVFQTFEQNLDVIKNRFRSINGAEYDSTSQDVMIPAFIAAYTGKDVRSMSLTPFPRNPAPNWRLDYTGLTRLDIFKNLFQSVTVSHSYQSSYGVTNYSNSLEYANSELGVNRSISDYNDKYFGDKIVDGSRVPVYVISQVLISEQFAPLIGINVRTKSRVTANLQYKTKRDLALTVSNAQITELSSKDVSFEMGFTKNNMKLPFKSQGRTVVLKNDVTFRLNLTVGNTRTIQRKINELNTLTNGNINFQLRPNISYTVNQKLTLQAYFERNINEPLISTSSRRATTRAGVQVRFSLAQ
jgi:cell surface protein SprA